MEKQNKSVFSGFVWKLCERFGVAGGQFILQIVLARMLEPEHYGILAIMIIFTTLATVFIQNGFNTALIQNKDVTEDDYSSVLWVSLMIAVILYGVIYLCAPLIGTYYDMPELVSPLRVLALMLIPGALNSVQLAKVSREMDFKKVFYSNLAAILVSGVVGILIAYQGGGLWALVVQNMLNVFVACIVMRFTVKLRIKFYCDVQRVRVLFSFGWKLLVSSLLDTLFQELRSLVIGKKYDSDTLGYYNRGKQFPQFLINAINGTVQSVMLPAMSAKQDDRAQVKAMMRNSITLSAFIVFPVMAGLAGVATPLVSLLLTEKWLPSVPYMQIYCFTMAFYPLSSCNLQAINAMGRSDIFLKLEIIKKSYALIVLLIAVFCFDTPIAIAMTGVFTTLISCFVNAYPNKKLAQYSYLEQVRDIMPSFLLSIIMLVCVLLVGLISLPSIWMLFLQIGVGILVYVLLAIITKVRPYRLVMQLLKQHFKNTK
ncbi:MAG: lipopolysaccharide biosynthesis protein [Lachnospiraceae bacterium]|nr:lipopolysaccharide biosynthesis protein [Lachnospiraceae bacterium]